MTKWKYAPTVSEERQRALLQAPSFQVISSRIAQTLKLLCMHSDSCDEASGYKRIVYCISVADELFDAFFNSWNGYRAQYFRSANHGQDMNAEFLRTVGPVLQTTASDSSIHSEFAAISLRAASSKAWLAEVGKGFCSRCAGEWRTADDEAADIFNDRWEHSKDPNATYGRKAPFLTKLRIMGGFVDSMGSEYVALRKRTRAAQICETGWS